MRIFAALILLLVWSPTLACLGTKELIKHYHDMQPGLQLSLGNAVHENAAHLLSKRLQHENVNSIYTVQSIVSDKGESIAVPLDAKGCLLGIDGEKAKAIENVSSTPIIPYNTLLILMELAKIDSEREKQEKEKQNGPMPQRDRTYKNITPSTEYTI